MTGVLDHPYTAGQRGYDFRRLRRKGFIERVEDRHVCRVTPKGPRFAC